MKITEYTRPLRAQAVDVLASHFSGGKAARMVVMATRHSRALANKGIGWETDLFYYEN